MSARYQAESTTVLQKEVNALDKEKTFPIRTHSDIPVVLVLVRGHNLSKEAMNFSLNVAGRLKHRILVAYVDTLPFLRNRGNHKSRFECGVEENVSVMLNKGKDRGVPVAYVKESGKIGRVASRLCRIVKKIDFIIVDGDLRLEDVVSRTPLPVFNVHKTPRINQHYPGERNKLLWQKNVSRCLL